MKTLVIYAHLLAACVSIGTLLLQDLALWRSRYRVLTQDEINSLRNTANIVFIALVVLWATGSGLVTMGYFENPEFFSNQKIWAKISVVIILSLNGVFLHFYSFPKVVGNKAILQLPSADQKWIGCSGALSTVSWLFACYLGIARTWNYSVDYSSIMLLYAGLVFFAFIVAHEVMRMSRTIHIANLNVSERGDRDTV